MALKKITVVTGQPGYTSTEQTSGKYSFYFE